MCKNRDQRFARIYTHDGDNSICINRTAVDGSCDFCGVKTSDPDYPCSLGCIQLPRNATITTEMRSEFIEPASCEWWELVDKKVWECSSLQFYHDTQLLYFDLSYFIRHWLWLVVQLWQMWVKTYPVSINCVTRLNSLNFSDGNYLKNSLVHFS